MFVKLLRTTLLLAFLSTNAQAAVVRTELAGAWYGERGTDGRLAAIVDGAYVQTHLGRVELPRLNGAPDLPLYLRITPVGEFKMCGQSHGGGGTWEWAHGEWHLVGPSFGVNACIYDYAGKLHIGAQQFGTQGFRWVNRDNSIVLGDLTYADPARRIWEWTEQGPLSIGQGENGCKVIAGADHRMIEPGHCTFVRYTREGAVNSVYMVKLLERKAVVLVFNDADLGTFPFETVVPPPLPPPPPPPPPQSCGEVPLAGQQALLKLAARPDVSVLVRSLNDDDRRKSALMLAEQLAFTSGPEWGIKRADPGRPQSKDSVSRIVAGVLCNWDIVNGTTRELSFGHGEPIPGQVFIPVTPKNHLGGTDPVDPPPPPPDVAKLKARIAELEAQLADVTEDRDSTLEALGELRGQYAEALTEIERLKNQPVPQFTCMVDGPGFLKFLFSCRVVPK